MVILGMIILSFNYVYFLYKKRYIAILKKCESNANFLQNLSVLLTISYTIFTFVFFFLVFE